MFIALKSSNVDIYIFFFNWSMRVRALSYVVVYRVRFPPRIALMLRDVSRESPD